MTLRCALYLNLYAKLLLPLNILQFKVWWRRSNEFHNQFQLVPPFLRRFSAPRGEQSSRIIQNFSIQWSKHNRLYKTKHIFLSNMKILITCNQQWNKTCNICLYLIHKKYSYVDKFRTCKLFKKIHLISYLGSE